MSLTVSQTTAFQRAQDTYLGLKVQNQTTSQWRNSLQLTSTELRYNFDDPSPQGIPYEGNYLGDPVTLCGANGYCSSGQAILDFGGGYPSLSNTHTAVQSLYALSNYNFKPDLSGSAGFRYSHEGGYTNYAGDLTPTTRNNFDSFLEAHGNLGHRAFATAGIGLEDYEVYGFAATPRVSAAYYLRRPSSNSFFNATKLRFNYGTGIDEPSILYQGESLFNVLSTLPNGPGLISQYHVSPIGPERSRDFDWGVEQWLWGGRARLAITGFRESFFDLIAFVDKSLLPELGSPGPVAAALPFGAYVNSDSYRSLGAEVELEAKLSRNFRVQAEYTYTDAVVTQSFASSAQAPSYNPAFPNIPIGAYTPLIGGRPFGVPRNSGSMALIYSSGDLECPPQVISSAGPMTAPFLRMSTMATLCFCPTGTCSTPINSSTGAAGLRLTAASHSTPASETSWMSIIKALSDTRPCPSTSAPGSN